jgi:hypothetical protein
VLTAKLFKSDALRFQDGGWKEEAESMPPKVKFWRDDGDTPYRKNHQ